MYRSVILIGLIFTFAATSASAQSSFRLPRPAETASLSGTDDLGLLDPQVRDDGSSGPSNDDKGLLGHYIYPNMRTAMSRSNFEIWRQEYCDPFLCPMVMCNGSCKVFAEHCPSLSDSARVLHINDIGCMSNVPVAIRAKQPAMPAQPGRDGTSGGQVSRHKSGDSNLCCKRKN